MAKTVQLKRGTTAQNLAYTGPVGEVLFDTQLKTLRAHDGLKLGGFQLINDLRGGSQGAISGDRNRVINGSCQIVNVATFVAVNNTSGYGGPEMFFAENSGAGGQYTQSQASLSFGGLTLPTVRQTVNTALTSLATGNYWFGIDQRLEGFNVFDLRGKQVALSFIFNTNLSGTYSVAVRDSNGTQSYVTTITAVANTPQQVSIPLAAIPSAADVPNTSAIGMRINVGALNTGTFQTATLNAWQSGNFFTATGATNWGATAGNFIELTNLQLEEGTVATDFIRRSYGVELALTQRYFGNVQGHYRRYDDTITANGTDGGMVHYTVPPRVTPTVSLTLTGSNVANLGGVTPQATFVLFSYVWQNTGPVARDASVTGTYSARL